MRNVWIFAAALFIGASLNPVFAADEASFRLRVDLLKAELEPYVRTTTGDVLLFNYFYTWPELPKDFTPAEYAEQSQERAWVPTQIENGSMLGRGLYFATDPVSSTSFGNHLLVMKVRAGTPYLDLNFYHPLTSNNIDVDIYVHQESFPFLTVKESRYTPKKVGAYQAFKWASHFHDIEANDVFRTASQELGIKMIEYPWIKRNNSKYCPWEKIRGAGASTFYALDLEFPEEDTKVFFPDGSDRGGLDLSFDEVRTMKVVLSGYDPEFSASLSEQQKKNMGERVRRELFRCGAGSTYERPEDQPLNLKSRNFKAALEGARKKVLQLIQEQETLSPLPQ